MWAGAMLATVALGHSAGAQAPSPRPSPTPAPTPVAFTAHAHASVTVVTQSATFNGSLQLGLAQRTNLTRIDVLNVKSDTLPIPPIGLTAVIDRGANTITIWNDVTKQYRVQPFSLSFARPSPGPSASPRPPRRVTSPFANLDVLALTIKLTGHTMTNGLPTTGLSLDFQVQGKGAKTAAHVLASTQLADEFAFFPMTLDVTAEPGAGLNAKLSYAVDDLTREMPPLSRFTVPAGYTQARSIPELVFQRRSPMTTAPSPSPSPR
jgi:hypothetical protein